MKKVMSYGYMSYAPERIEIEKVFYFGELVTGEEDLEQLLNDRCVAIDDDIIEFDVIDNNEDGCILNALVQVTDIY